MVKGGYLMLKRLPVAAIEVMNRKPATATNKAI